jgi:uncharacterized protein (DUF1697 family)
LNSGNLIVKTEKTREEITKIVENAIYSLFKLNISVIIVDKKQLENAIKNNPYTGTEYMKSKTLVYFTTKGVDIEKLEDLDRKRSTDEKYSYNKECLYIYYGNGVGKSKLTTAYIDKILGLETTGRNVNTIEELVKRW